MLTPEEQYQKVGKGRYWREDEILRPSDIRGIRPYLKFLHWIIVFLTVLLLTSFVAFAVINENTRCTPGSDGSSQLDGSGSHTAHKP